MQLSNRFSINSLTPWSFVSELTVRFISIIQEKQSAWVFKEVHCIHVCMQRFGALVLLLTLSPIMLLTWIAIRTESQGEVIYTQVRIGLLGRRFRIYKFRSMYIPEDPKYVDTSHLASDRQGICKKIFKYPKNN